MLTDYQAHIRSQYSTACLGDGIACDGGDCICGCHNDSAPFFATNTEVVEWHRDEEPNTASTCAARNCDYEVGEYIGDGWVRMWRDQVAYLDSENHELYCKAHAGIDHAEVDGEVKVF